MGSREKIRRANKKQSAWLVLGIVLLAAAAYGYLEWYATKELVTAHFESPTGEKTESYTLEVASTAQSRAKGLMFRKENDLPGRRGMLFIYPIEEQLSFWMKNTYISLDMIFIDSKFNVVGVVHDAPVLSEKPLKVDGKSRYVVELKAGSAKVDGIDTGWKFVPQGEIQSKD